MRTLFLDSVILTTVCLCMCRFIDYKITLVYKTFPIIITFIIGLRLAKAKRTYLEREEKKTLNRQVGKRSSSRLEKAIYKGYKLLEKSKVLTIDAQVICNQMSPPLEPIFLVHSSPIESLPALFDVAYLAAPTMRQMTATGKKTPNSFRHHEMLTMNQ